MHENAFTNLKSEIPFPTWRLLILKGEGHYEEVFRWQKVSTIDFQTRFYCALNSHSYSIHLEAVAGESDEPNNETIDPGLLGLQSPSTSTESRDLDIDRNEEEIRKQKVHK